MLTKTDLERRFDANGETLNGELFPAERAETADSERRARRLNRNRRDLASSYRRPTGWSVGLW